MMHDYLSSSSSSCQGDQQQFLQTISNIFSNFTSTYFTRRCVEISLNNLYVDIGAKGLRYIKFLES